MRITPTAPNVYSEFGILLPIGVPATVGDEYGKTLVLSLRAADTDGVLPGVANPPFLQAPISQAPVSGASAASRLNSLFGTAPMNVHVFGNSIAAQNTFTDLESMSSGLIKVVANDAVGGTNSTQVLARIQSVGINPAADAVMYLEGANDAAGGVTVAAHYANMAAIRAVIIAAGKVPILIKAGPTDLSYKALLEKMAYAQYCLAIKTQTPMIDCFQSLCLNTGGFKSGKSSDGLHPNRPACGEADGNIIAILKAKTPPQHLPRSQAGIGLIGSNVQMLTDTNADGVPDGWNHYNDGTCAISDAAAPALGKKVTVTATNVTALPASLRTVTFAAAAGDVIRFTGRGRFVSCTADNGLFLISLTFTLAAGGNYAVDVVRTSAKTVDPLYLDALVTLPGAVTGCLITVQIASAGSMGTYSAVYEWDSIELASLTALGIPA